MKRPVTQKVAMAIAMAAMVMSTTACGSKPAPAAAPAAPAAEAAPVEEAVEEEAEAEEEEVVEEAEEEEAEAEEAEEAEEEEAEEEESPYTVITDENGDPIDLGGMEIIIRDWWSPEEAPEPTNEYEEAREEYREWIQDTYNFTIKQVAISDWGSTPADFVDYATTGGDENYVWILRDDPAITSAMASGLMYDLSTLDCLDFSSEKFQRNKLHEQYSKGDEIYAMYAGFTEPRTGVYS